MPAHHPSRARRPVSCLVLCLKAPERSKRRLAAALGEETTVAATHLLACALEDVRAWPGAVALAPAEAADADWLTRCADLPYPSIVQQGDSLGERINSVDAVLRSRGYERLIYIGADCPTLDGAYLARADAALDRNDAVIGPATDGGVVLMGARKPWPEIGDLAWSTAALLDGLVERLTAEAWTIAALDALTDIDALDDFSVLGRALSSDERPARKSLVEWLRAHERLGDRQP